jgi:tetratricopeptide (TPR) repeat protein
LVGYWFVQVREVLGPAFPFPVIKLRFPETIKIIVILPLLGLAGGFFMLQGSNILYERGDARGQAGDIDGFVRDLNLADRMAMHKNAMALVMAARTLHTAMDDPMSKAAQGDLEKAEQLLDEAEALNPKLVIIPYTHAQLAKIADEKDLDGGGNEKDYLEAALAMNPLYFPARVELADYYSAHGEAVKAYVTLQEGVKWQYAADVPPEYYEALAREATAQGRLEVAGEAMKQLLLMQRAGAK